MATLFASGRIVDLILALTVLEFVGLWVWRTHTGNGPAPFSAAVSIAAGICLLVALRVALVDGWWGWIAIALLASLVAHALDMAQRWRD